LLFYAQGCAGRYLLPAISALPPSVVVVFHKEPWKDNGSCVIFIHYIYVDNGGVASMG